MPKVPKIDKTKYMPKHLGGKTIVCFRGDTPITTDEGARLDNFMSQTIRHHKRRQGQNGV